LAQTGVEKSVRDKYETPPDGLSPGDQNCQNGIGKALAALAADHYKITNSCQKRFDGAKADIPSTVKSCKDADPKGKRSKAESPAKLEATLQKACAEGNLSNLDGICDGAVDSVDLALCVLANGRELNDAFSFAAYPETIPAIPGDCPSSIEYQINAGTGLGHDMDFNHGSRFRVNVDCGEICDASTSNAGAACTSDAECNAQCYPLGGGPPTGGCTIQADCPGTEICRGGCILEAPCGTCSITGLNAQAGNCRCANDITALCDEPSANDIDDCGGALCQCYLDSPQPLTAAAVPACFMNRIAGPVTGQVNVDFGPVQFDLDLRTDVHVGIAINQPCPICDAGICNGGPNDGLDCTATSNNATFGTMSLDCPPDPLALVSGTGLIQRGTHTTGTSSLGAAIPCEAPFNAFNCHCALCSGDLATPCNSNAECSGVGGSCISTGTGVTRRPNDCSDLTCTPGVTNPGEGTCANGPTDLFCAGETRHDGSGYIPCTTDADCSAVGPGVGPCTLSSQRECFPDAILASGVPSPNSPVTVSTMCLPPTASAAINGSLGLPGPARISMQMTPTIGCTLGASVYEPEIGGCFAPKTVFITSLVYDGNLGGLAGADAKCNALASSAGLTGTFTAWLSDTLEDARSRVTHSPHPYVDTRGTIVANDWADLIDGTIDAAIMFDEDGIIGDGGNEAWSATDTDGTQAPGTSAASTCSDWTSNAATGPIALTGLYSATDANWTDCVAAGGCVAANCNSPVRLYCFED
jgi:hypothetical protein